MHPPYAEVNPLRLSGSPKLDVYETEPANQPMEIGFFVPPARRATPFAPRTSAANPASTKVDGSGGPVLPGGIRAPDVP